MPYHYDPDDYHPIYNEIGRLVFYMPHLDTALLCLMADAYPEKGWIELSLLRSSQLIDLWEAAIARFPHEDHHLLQMHVDRARELYELRNIIVHGRWWPVGADNQGQYVVERVLTKTQARKETGRADQVDTDYPAQWMPMNLATVAMTLRFAKQVREYLLKHVDRWEAHFGGPVSRDAKAP